MDDVSQLSHTVDDLRRNMDDVSQLSHTVDDLKRDMDDVSQLSNTVDDLKRNMDIEKNRSAVLEACLREQVSCPNGYQLWRGICYKVFNTREPFNEAAATCRKDGGTLAMPRDAETNAFLISLYTSIRGDTLFFIGLQDQHEEGRFEWADGSALGAYSPWGPGEPDGHGDCVVSGASSVRKDKWYNFSCDLIFRFICQVNPGHRCTEVAG
ncbi:alpha-N-acetylgalactosamine-specific lectin-like [Branchiostoma floridae]|uniref:Alpha-N-acetylgalactosamine-specific lectin-like n=1 Tax=Branchiostoma floridae TaxID=7739 RepID=A0A9J7LT69_BRAFL|nr:alpha-N-acetylgalactosamine-specific lectin-like [Branchiostoma floridae]